MQHFTRLKADSGRYYWLNEAHITFVAATSNEKPAKGFLVGIIGLPKPIRISDAEQMAAVRKMIIDTSA